MNPLQKLRNEVNEFFEYHERAVNLIIARLQELGHVLKTTKDTAEEWEFTDGTDEVDTSAYSNENHNGPVCKLCGDDWCLPCMAMKKIWPEEKCEGPYTEGTGKIPGGEK